MNKLLSFILSIGLLLMQADKCVAQSSKSTNDVIDVVSKILYSNNHSITFISMPVSIKGRNNKVTIVEDDHRVYQYLNYYYPLLIKDLDSLKVFLKDVYSGKKTISLSINVWEDTLHLGKPLILLKNRYLSENGETFLKTECNCTEVPDRFGFDPTKNNFVERVEALFYLGYLVFLGDGDFPAIKASSIRKP